ncbi:hypothetical protein PsB1_0066 [Candidatus Phycosocius spiralis]|uniref:Uncharacterized protein n=1 Tax=Candidatus Phycosocius spiralis TaxID=2815099 RepID=A0ABQ4PSC9_9PROT|nr:hypothetical protein PsB1_0066 [Candidatus Phycosocius spiralis]
MTECELINVSKYSCVNQRELTLCSIEMQICAQAVATDQTFAEADTAPRTYNW